MNIQKQLYLGIDVGKTGAMAVFNNTEYYPIEIIRFDHLDCIETELPKIIREICFGIENVFVCIEKVGYIVGDGGKGAFTFGTQYGIIKGIIGTLEIPRKEVLPTKWKRHFGLINSNLSYRDKKKKIKEKVLQHYPELTKYPLSVYDSILIAEYCKKQFTN